MVKVEDIDQCIYKFFNDNGYHGKYMKPSAAYGDMTDGVKAYTFEDVVNRVRYSSSNLYFTIESNKYNASLNKYDRIPAKVWFAYDKNSPHLDEKAYGSVEEFRKYLEAHFKPTRSQYDSHMPDEHIWTAINKLTTLLEYSLK